MKIVVLGGSSPSTPLLFRCVAACSSVASLQFCLVGRSRQHLDQVLRAVQSLSAGVSLTIDAFSFEPLELSSALREADLILVQIRFGGYVGRHFDETFPLKYGLCGDEGLGPGGLSAAWRAWPAMHHLISTIVSVCPRAIVLMLSSPVALFVGSARCLYPALRTFGICELPWTTLQDIATLFEIDPTAIDFDYFGVNHIGWFYRLDYEARDLLQEYATRQHSSLKWPSPELVSSCQAFPTKYLRLHYDRQKVLDEQRRSRVSRAEILAKISLDSYTAFQSGNKEDILRSLAQRSALWYPHAIVPLLHALSRSDTRIPFFLTQPNGGYEAGFPSEDVLEIPTYVSSGEFFPKPCRQCPPFRIRETGASFVAYESKATKALIQQDAGEIKKALEIHPWVGDPELAAVLTAEITAQPQVEAH